MNKTTTMTNPWTQLHQTSQGLKQASSGDNMFTDDDITSLENIVKQVIRNFLKKGELHKGIKVFVDRELDNSVVNKMVARPPLEDESIEAWSQEIFGKNKFGVIFNSLEMYSNDLAEKMCTIVSPLLEKAGLPLGGLSFLFFMGNYGFTPFGIHKEAKGEEGFLFHLGPADKKFYTWDIDEYNKIEHNTRVFHEVDEMLPDAKCYELKPKSVMFIPHHLYHIGNTDEFSLSVVMDYINPSRSFLEKKIAEKIANEETSIKVNEDYLKPLSFDSPAVGLDNLLNSEKWGMRYKNALNKSILRLKSNCGVLKPAIIEPKDFEFGDNAKLVGKRIFPMQIFVDDQNQTFLYARGHEICLPPNHNLSLLISRLNGDEKISLAELQRTLFPDWDLVDIFSFVNRLSSISAVVIEN